MEYVKEHIGLICAVAGGLMVSVLTSEKHSFASAVARLGAGLFCSVFLTDPFISWMALDSDTYRNAIAGLFSMTGYAMTRFVVNMDRTAVLDVIKAFRGGK